MIVHAASFAHAAPLHADYLEYFVDEVEMRAQMELMVEFKAGNHVDWNPDAIIEECHATFPDNPAPGPEDDPSSLPVQENENNADVPPSA